MKRLFTTLIALVIIIPLQNFVFAGNNETSKNVSVNEVIKDGDGDPLAGATITEKRKNNSVITAMWQGLTYLQKQTCLKTLKYT
jgi:hypothetical protein